MSESENQEILEEVQNAVDEVQESGKVDKGDLPQSHSQLNAILSKHRKNLQKELNETKQQASEREKAFLDLKSQVEKFTEGQPVDEFMKGVEETLSLLDSEADKKDREAKKTAKSLAEAQERANSFESRYNKAMFWQAVREAAGAKAVSDAAVRLIGRELEDKYTVTDDGQVVFRMKLADEDGEFEERDVEAREAVEALEKDVSNFGTLFKSTVNSGLGSETDGMTRTKEGKVDVMGMDYGEFRKLKRENPELYKDLINRQLS